MKIFASDLDGTLFFKHLEKGYRQEDIDAIKKFQAEGNLFGCCTGRALNGALPSFENLLACDFYIVSSGAVICDKNLNVIYDCPIDLEVAKKMIEEYKNQVTVFIQTLRYHTINSGHPKEMFNYIDSLDDIKNETLYGLCLVTENHDLLDRIEIEIKEKYPEVAGYKNMDAIDIVAKGCSKGVALNKVKELFNADSSYGIGDSYNDIPLIQEADLGMTFFTSPQQVKDEANLLVNSIEEALQNI